MAWDKIYSAISAGLSPREQRAVILGLLFGMTTLHAAWACGLLPGIEGFATLSQVRQVVTEEVSTAEEVIEAEVKQHKNQLADEIRSLRIELIIERIDVIHTQACNTDSNELKNELAKKLRRNLAKYRGLQGYSYSLTPCEGL